MDSGLQELLKEYASLRLPGHTPSGLYIAMILQKPRRWQGIICIHKGYYAGAVFRFMLKLDKYPETLPHVVFQGNVWHPLVSKQGELNLAAALGAVKVRTEQATIPANESSCLPNHQQSPTSSVNISSILHGIKASFKKIVLDHIKETDAFDMDAFRAFVQRPDLFGQLARQCVQASVSKAVLYTQDGYDMPIRLSDPDADRDDGVSGMEYKTAMSMIKEYMQNRT
jgi:ubiquitin-protein ligase